MPLRFCHSHLIPADALERRPCHGIRHDLYKAQDTRHRLAGMIMLDRQVAAQLVGVIYGIHKPAASTGQTVNCFGHWVGWNGQTVV